MDREDSKSLEHYKRLKYKAERNGNIKGQAEACSIIGEIYSRYERYDEAIEEYQQGLILSEAENCPIGIALANRKLGECYCKKQIFDRAIPLHKRYLSLARECGDKVEEQRALATLGATYLAQCECEQTLKGKRNAYKLAEEAFMKGLEAAEEIKATLKEVDYNDMKGRLFQNLGLLYDEMNKWETSSQYFQKALAINKKYGLLENLYLCQSSLVSVYQKHANMGEAGKYVDQCVETAQKMKTKDSEADALMLKSMFLLQENKFQQSRHFFKKAHKVGLPSQKEKFEKCYKHVKILHKGTETQMDISETDHNTRINLFDKMGDAASELGLYRQAIYYYEKLLQASVDMQKEKKTLATVHVSLAETYRDCKQFDKAVQHYKHEIECRSEQEQDQICRSWLNIGAIQELLYDNCREPQDSYVKAFNCAKKAKNRKLQVESLENLIALFKCHKVQAQLQASKDKLNAIVSKYHITESESEEYSKDESLGDKDDDSGEMSELTESEDEEVPPNTVSRTTIKSGRTTKRKVFKRNLKGETPLHTACIDGKLQEVLKLLSQGHPVNVRDNGGWTPLHEASNFGYVDIVRTLIEHGANVNDRGGTECNGLTPVMDAASNGMIECVEILLKNGANIHAKDDNMLTVLDHLNDYFERAEDELTESEKSECRTLMGILKDRMPFHRAPQKPNLTQKSALIPETEAEKFTKTAEKKRSRNNFICDDLNSFEDDDEVCEIKSKTTRKCSPSPEYTIPPHIPDELSSEPNLKDLTLDDGNAALVYKKAIAGIGSSAQRSSQLVRKSQKQSTRKAALVAEDDYVQDDWLIDDIKPSAKRRKMNVDGYKFTSELTLSKQTDNTYPQQGTGKQAIKRKTKRVELPSDSEEDNDSELVFETENMASPCGSEVSDVPISPFRSSPVPRVLDDFPAAQQSKLQNENESAAGSAKELSSVDLTKDGSKSYSDTRQKINRQMKLTDFGAVVSNSIPNGLHSQSVRVGYLSSVATTNDVVPQGQTVTSSPQQQSTSSVIKIKVQIQDKLLLIPVVDRDGTKTVSWLIEEVATRYSKMFGLKPRLNLGTKDGAHFSPEDLITLILSDGEKIEGFLQSWDLPPMTQQYKTACKSLNTVMYKNIETVMHNCEERTGKLNLTDLSLRPVRFQPVLRAIQHQSCLRELELKGNHLGDSGIESLSHVFDTLPNLTYLGLSCNNITKVGLCHIAEGTSKDKESVLKSLSHLDVSFNPLFDESQKEMMSVIKMIPSINKVCIASCNLTAAFFQNDRPTIAQVLNDSRIQHIDISYNLLENTGVYFFLRCLNPCKMLTLNLSSTAVKSSAQLLEHICDFLSQDGCMLQHMELRSLNSKAWIPDQLMRLTKSASQLQSLNLSANVYITNEAMRNVVQGSCHTDSKLEKLLLMDCGIKSPLSLELLDVIVEKMAMPFPLRDLQFSCYKLTPLDYDSLVHVWREKWSDVATVSTVDDSVKLGVTT